MDMGSKRKNRVLMAGNGWVENGKIILKRKKRGKSKLVYVML